MLCKQFNTDGKSTFQRMGARKMTTDLPKGIINSIENRPYQGKCAIKAFGIQPAHQRANHLSRC